MGQAVKALEGVEGPGIPLCNTSPVSTRKRAVIDRAYNLSHGGVMCDEEVGS